MVRSYKKGVPSRLTARLLSTHFDCRCKRPECAVTLIDDVLYLAVDAFYAITAHRINDAFRCVAHNKEVGGALHSYHQLGKACDFQSIHGLLGQSMAKRAELVPDFRNGGIGTYDSFVHCDVRGYEARWDLTSFFKKKYGDFTPNLSSCSPDDLTEV